MTIAITLAALLSLFGCGSSNNSSGAMTATITTRNNASAPMGFSFDSPVTVRSATVVRWNNISSAPHSIVWDAHTPSSSPAPGANIGTFQPGTMSDAWTAPVVTTATNYNYHCGIHGPTMAGVVTVTP